MEGSNKNDMLGKFLTKLIYDNLTESELEIAEQIAKEYNESKVKHNKSVIGYGKK